MASYEESVRLQFIKDFITDLYTSIGNEEKPLTLYYRFLTKIEKPVQDIVHRHIEAFRNFCLENQEAIAEQSVEKLDPTRIEFSAKIYIDIPHLLGLLDEGDDRVAVWNHLKLLTRCLTKNLEESELQQLMEARKTTNGKNVITELMASFQDEMESSNIQMTDNPMEMVMQLMTSGVVDNIVGKFQQKLQSGELDISEMMSAAQSMTQSIQKDMDGIDDPMLQGMMQNMQNMMGNFEEIVKKPNSK